MPSEPDFDQRLAQIRHELRTPLNAIIGYSEMLLDELEDRALTELAVDAERIRTAGTRLLGMIDTHLRPDVAMGLASPTQIGAKSVDEVVHRLERADHVGRVLIVDDIEENRSVLRRVLQRLGHEVFEVSGGREALAAVSEWHPDVVLLDVMMPEMDGYEVLARLKSDPQTSELPVLMVSALDQLETVVRCIEAGAEDYLPKPFNPVLLQARIGACLEKRALREAERCYVEDLRLEREKSDRLLLNILPASIAERLKAGEHPIADALTEVTVLFADLVGFTEYAGSVPASEVVATLSEIFMQFDEAVLEAGLEKIKTIGDAYLAVGGLPPASDAQTQGAVRLGWRMIDILKEEVARNGAPLQLRVGIHRGPVVTGVIGRTKLAFDLWGDTVNVAARMEATGIPGRVQVSDALRMTLGHSCRWTPRGELEIKGKGLMSVWLADPN